MNDATLTTAAAAEPAQTSAPAGEAPQAPAPSAPVADGDPAIFLADKVELWPTSKLKPDPRNAREHDADQITDLRRLIRRLGFVRPVMARGTQTEGGMLIAGEALKAIEGGLA